MCINKIGFFVHLYLSLSVLGRCDRNEIRRGMTCVFFSVFHLFFGCCLSFGCLTSEQRQKQRVSKLIMVLIITVSSGIHLKWKKKQRANVCNNHDSFAFTLLAFCCCLFWHSWFYFTHTETDTHTQTQTLSVAGCEHNVVLNKCFPNTVLTILHLIVLVRVYFCWFYFMISFMHKFSAQWWWYEWKSVINEKKNDYIWCLM